MFSVTTALKRERAESMPLNNLAPDREAYLNVALNNYSQGESANVTRGIYGPITIQSDNPRSTNSCTEISVCAHMCSSVSWRTIVAFCCGTNKTDQPGSGRTDSKCRCKCDPPAAAARVPINAGVSRSNGLRFVACPKRPLSAHSVLPFVLFLFTNILCTCFSPFNPPPDGCQGRLNYVIDCYD
ncbi:hypothetical protein J6590_001561 [Homalodisca vitripennis]|nr:hypothetical protein J6590_001561 [Homalodisca vitripennis]